MTPSSGASTASANVIYQIACGSSAAISPYTADTYYTGGSTSAYPSNTVSTSGVNNPAPASVYKNLRTGPFSYTLPNLVAGQIYTVRLHFAELFHALPGQRQFNVLINGTTVLTNFDVAAVAGGPNIAVVEAFPMAANSSGQIIISVTAGAFDIPMISGIELVTGFRISSSGPGASYWEADQSYNLGGVSYLPAVTITTSQTSDTAPAIVYQYNRYGGTNYTINGLTAGNVYAVRLHFAETVYSAPGMRQFNVAINGSSVLTDYDIYGQSGGKGVAIIPEFDVKATSAGQITIALSPGAVDGPIIEGVEMTGGGGSVLASGQYLISGKVTLGGTGPSVGAAVSGVTLTLSGTQSGVAVSASDGTYSFVVKAGSYQISAASQRYYITGPLSISNLSSSQANENFSALLLAGNSLAPTSPHIEYIFMNGQVVALEHPH